MSQTQGLAPTNVGVYDPDPGDRVTVTILVNNAPLTADWPGWLVFDPQNNRLSILKDIPKPGGVYSVLLRAIDLSGLSATKLITLTVMP